jgi:plasmid stabilization system protein ParE
MPDPSGQWNGRLATRAEKDLREIVAWTAEQFGEKQARVYAGTLSAAIVALKGGPDILARRDWLGGMHPPCRTGRAERPALACFPGRA